MWKDSKKGLGPRVTSYSQSAALIPPEASPHKRKLKCDTNISLRRLIHIYYIRWYITVQSSEEVDTRDRQKQEVKRLR